MKRPHAFTLIELLVVLAIVALLVALLMPSLGKAKDAAKRVVCASNLKQIGIAVSAYRNDHKARYPASTVWSSSSPELLLPYISEALLYTSVNRQACPDFYLPINPTGTYGAWMVNGNLIGGLSTSEFFHQYHEVIHPDTTFLFTHGTPLATWSPTHLDQLCNGSYYGQLHLKGTGYNIHFVDNHIAWVPYEGPSKSRWWKPQRTPDSKWFGASEMYGP